MRIHRQKDPIINKIVELVKLDDILEENVEGRDFTAIAGPLARIKGLLSSS